MPTSITCPSCEATYKVPTESLGAGRQVRCKRCRTEWFAEPVQEPAQTSVQTADDADWTEAIAEQASGATLGPSPEPILGLEDANQIDVFDRPGALEDGGAPRSAPRPSLTGPGRLRRLLAARKPSAPKPPRPAKPRLSSRVRPTAIAVAAGVVALGVLVGGRVEAVRAVPSLASLYGALGLEVNVRGLAIRDVRSVEELSEGSPLLLVTGIVENVSGVELDVPRLRLAVTAAGEREIYAWTTVAARSKLQPGETATFRARLASPPAEGQAIAVRFLARRDLMASIGR